MFLAIVLKIGLATSEAVLACDTKAQTLDVLQAENKVERFEYYYGQNNACGIIWEPITPIAVLERLQVGGKEYSVCTFKYGDQVLYGIGGTVIDPNYV